MKLVYITEFNLFFQSNANSNRVRGLLEGLVNMGVKVQVLIYGGYSNEKERKNCGLSYMFNGIECKYFNTSKNYGYFNYRYQKYISRVFTKPIIVNKILKYLVDFNGIVWTDLSLISFSLVTKLNTSNKQCKLFLEMSEYLDIYKFNKGNLIQKNLEYFKQKTFESKISFIYNGIALMTNSLYCHYSFLKLKGVQLLHLPMTVDLNRFYLCSETLPLTEFKKPYIAYVGVMNDLKDGVNILISAFDKIKNNFNEYSLYLIGPYDYDTPNHLRFIEQKGLKSRVFWMNVYDRDKIPNIICNADLLVLPRPDSKQAQGGFPTKLGEYLASGKPVCATRVGEIPNYLTDNHSVFFAEPGSVESFAEAMERALSNTENAIRVGTNGRKVAEIEFNKIIQAKKLFDFLRDLKTGNTF